MKSSFLLIGPWPSHLKEWGSEIVPDLGEAKRFLKDNTTHVLGLSVTSVLEKKFQEFYDTVVAENPAIQWVVVVPADFPSETLTKLHHQFHFFRVLNDFQHPQLEAHFYAALEESHQRQQDENLVRLISEQRKKLLALQSELESRVDKRTKFLTESRRKLFITNTRIEGLKKSLMAVHQASSVPDIERMLSENLASSVDISWIRIFYDPQDDLFEQQVEQRLNFAQFRIPLYNNHKQIGSIFFMRPPTRQFLKEETDFLNRVAEAVSLSLDRIQKLRETETVKEHWENTFNALSEPVLIIDNNYDVLQANESTRRSRGETALANLNVKCYQLLFNRSEPCLNCSRGENFRLNLKNQHKPAFFDVHSQSLVLENNAPPVYVNFYHDITEKVEMEKQIIESARLAEIGTIGSSIAHELNNPLGGILTFSQLIKMEMPASHALYQDIVEIEKGAQRCKEIVQNLLGFTRTPLADKISDVRIAEAVQRALKIVELQTKSTGVEVHLIQDPQQEYKVNGHLNLLSQAIRNILQVALDMVMSQQKSQPSFRGKLDIFLHKDPEKIRIEIHNHLPFSQKPGSGAGLAIPIATQILHDHQAELQFLPDSANNWTAKISFSRPVLSL